MLGLLRLTWRLMLAFLFACTCRSMFLRCLVASVPTLLTIFYAGASRDLCWSTPTELSLLSGLARSPARRGPVHAAGEREGGGIVIY